MINGNTVVEWLSIALLFCLVFGMSATVDSEKLKQQVRNQQAIITGLVLQFIVLPLLGFWVVVTLRLDFATGLTLLVVTTSPGGSYSNWWCSLFNAELALSVTMTAISTMVSCLMMPLNLFLYAKLVYQHNDNNNDDNDNEEVVNPSSLPWGSMIFTLLVVISAIGLGLLASAAHREAEFNLRMNQMGNVAGVALVIVSAVISATNPDARVWDREWQFYIGVAVPCIVGLFVANVVTTGLALDKPERVTVSIETCYQNVGIATSMALTMFKNNNNNNDLAKAIGVPLYYGMVEALILLIYCLGAWQAGWTKAPKNTHIWKMISTSYEVARAGKGDIDPDYQAYVEHQELSQRQHQHHHNSPHHSPTGGGTATLAMGLEDVDNGMMINPNVLMPESRNREFSAA